MNKYLHLLIFRKDSYFNCYKIEQKWSFWHSLRFYKDIFKGHNCPSAFRTRKSYAHRSLAMEMGSLSGVFRMNKNPLCDSKSANIQIGNKAFIVHVFRKCLIAFHCIYISQIYLYIWYSWLHCWLSQVALSLRGQK